MLCLDPTDKILFKKLVVEEKNELSSKKKTNIWKRVCVYCPRWGTKSTNLQTDQRNYKRAFMVIFKIIFIWIKIHVIVQFYMNVKMI